MNLFRTIRESFRAIPQDEREDNAKKSASWKAIVLLIICYIAIALFYDAKMQIIPVSTQILFYVAFFTFIYFSYKNDAYSYRIPLIPETRDTLNASRGARIVPFLYFWVGILFASIALF